MNNIWNKIDNELKGVFYTDSYNDIRHALYYSELSESIEICDKYRLEYDEDQLYLIYDWNEKIENKTTVKDALLFINEYLNPF